MGYSMPVWREKLRKMTEVDNQTIEEMTYEEAYKELEMVVNTLESGDQSLDDSLNLFERGQKLIKRCSLLLEKAELKVKKLNEGTLESFTEGE
jgi:exodeoxyribonuclease VII small subunit